jgi:hypothetical protein
MSVKIMVLCDMTPCGMPDNRYLFTVSYRVASEGSLALKMTEMKYSLIILFDKYRFPLRGD